MSWAKFDDRYPWNPKVQAPGPHGLVLHVASICYSSMFLTDGFIATHVVKSLYPIPKPEKVAVHLVNVGLLEAVAGGYHIHDYHDFNPRAEQVRAKRA